MHGLLTTLGRGFKKWIGWKRLGIAAGLRIIAFAVTRLARDPRGCVGHGPVTAGYNPASRAWLPGRHCRLFLLPHDGEEPPRNRPARLESRAALRPVDAAASADWRGRSRILPDGNVPAD